MEINHIIGAGLFIGLLFAWRWANKRIQRMIEDEHREAVFAREVIRQRKTRRKEVFRNGFGKNFFQPQAKRKVAEREIDRIIKEVQSSIE